MKVETGSSENIWTIIVLEYDKSEYSQLLSLVKSFDNFYPAYQSYSRDESKMIIFGTFGWLKDSKVDNFDDNWKYYSLSDMIDKSIEYNDKLNKENK